MPMVSLGLASGVQLVRVLKSVYGYALSSASLSLRRRACYRVRSCNNVIFHFRKTRIHVSFQLTQLCRRLDEIWKENEGDVIMFLWMRFLKDDALTFLKVTTPLDLSHAVASMKLKCGILQW